MFEKTNIMKVIKKAIMESEKPSVIKSHLWKAIHEEMGRIYIFKTHI